MVQWQGVNVGKAQDLGSGPRSFMFPSYFLIAIPMRFKAADAPYAFQNPAYTRPGDQIKGSALMNTINLSQYASRLSEKVKWIMLIGPESP